MMIDKYKEVAPGDTEIGRKLTPLRSSDGEAAE
jgi:hypothetical protein